MKAIISHAAAIGLTLGLTMSLFLHKPNPYDNVEVVEVSRKGDIVTIGASFTKNRCQFVRLETVGVTFGGIYELVNWEPVDIDTKDYDRSKGRQFLIVDIDTEGYSYERLEIRTRHDCGGELVDKVFVNVAYE